MDTPSPRVFAAGREEAPERRLVLRGAGAPFGPRDQGDAAGPRLRALGPAHAANLACELRPAAWQPQVRRLGAGSLSEPPRWRAPLPLSARSLVPLSPPSAGLLPTLSASSVRDLCSFCS